MAGTGIDRRCRLRSCAVLLGGGEGGAGPRGRHPAHSAVLTGCHTVERPPIKTGKLVFVADFSRTPDIDVAMAFAKPVSHVVTLGQNSESKKTRDWSGTPR